MVALQITFAFQIILNSVTEQALEEVYCTAQNIKAEISLKKVPRMKMSHVPFAEVKIRRQQ